ncbi:MAG TPA: signal peptide peptidase SppA, partial [Nevskiaceae bacterium]|nr:signal peptide peptidase SppA [Nevskiaceae bacterium]
MSEQKSFLRRFFGGIWLLGVGIYRFFVLIGIVMLLVMVYGALRGGAPVKIENHVALVIAPTGALVEQVDKDPGAELFEQFSDQPP